MSKKFLSLLALFFLLPLIYMQFKYGGTEIKQYIFPLLSYGIIVYGSNFFDKKYYVGRTMQDVPDIDGLVYIKNDRQPNNQF